MSVITGIGKFASKISKNFRQEFFISTVCEYWAHISHSREFLGSENHILSTSNVFFWVWMFSEWFWILSRVFCLPSVPIPDWTDGKPANLLITVFKWLQCDVKLLARLRGAKAISPVIFFGRGSSRVPGSGTVPYLHYLPSIPVSDWIHQNQMIWSHLECKCNVSFH